MEEKERKGGKVGMITRKMDMQYNESRIITAILKVVATAELCDPDATEETIRYCVEQDLEDVGFDVSVELLKERELVKDTNVPNKWISVKDRLPEERINPNTNDFEYVLCATVFGDVRAYKYGMIDGNTEAHFWHGFCMMDKWVTHWMPLPEPPQEDEDGHNSI